MINEASATGGAEPNKPANVFGLKALPRAAKHETKSPPSRNRSSKPEGDMPLTLQCVRQRDASWHAHCCARRHGYTKEDLTQENWLAALRQESRPQGATQHGRNEGRNTAFGAL